MSDYQAAVEARARSAGGLSDKVYDTVRLDSRGGLLRENYLIIGTAISDLGDGRLTSGQHEWSAADVIVDVRAVGTTATAVRDLLSRLRGVMLAEPLAVPHRKCDPTKHVKDTKVFPDMSVTPPIYYADSEFTVRAGPRRPNI